MNVKYLNIIGEEFNSFTNDLDRWRCFLKNKEIFSLALDGDQTIIEFNKDIIRLLPEEDRESLIELRNFEFFIGDSRGLWDLLKALNIKYELV